MLEWANASNPPNKTILSAKIIHILDEKTKAEELNVLTTNLQLINGAANSGWQDHLFC